MTVLRTGLAALVLFCCAMPGMFGAVTVPPAAQATAQFDAVAATNAWLATVPAKDKARSDAYFEGGYWLQLWDILLPAGVMVLLLSTRWSVRMRDLARRVTRFLFLQTIVYWFQLAAVTALLTFPLTVYEGYFREHQYDLSNQTLGAWFRDEAIGFALILIAGGLLAAAFFAVIRRFPQGWPAAATLVVMVFTVFAAAIAPVYIVPLFNSAKPLGPSPIRDEILSLAHENGVPATDVFEIDASRQSKRVSANVSGFGSTERITLNDNLLKRVSPEGVLGVMGHEMGHYVLHHVLNGLMFALLSTGLLFYLLQWLGNWLLSHWGGRWQIGGWHDLAVMPLLLLILLALNFVFTPIGNTFTRTQEYEADLYGLNAARQPDGEAEVDLLLGEYRKLDPTPLEEFIFFDHPSGRTRIYAAMRWKAENLCLFNPALPCKDQPAPK